MKSKPNTSGDGQGVTSCTLTAEQEKNWANTMSLMMWTAPGFQHLLYKMLNAQVNAQGTPWGQHVAVMSRDVPIAATDGRNLILNPDKFFGDFNVRERVFITAHEVVHNVYSDVEFLHRCVSSGVVPTNHGTTIPFDMNSMQKAMDLRINALLIESKIGTPPKVGHFDKNIKGTDSVLDVYEKVYKHRKDDPGDEGFDQILPPGSGTGQNPQTAVHQRNPQQWAVEVQIAQTIEHARTQGNIAASLKRLFQNILEPEVSWIDHIETLINRATGGGGYDWTTPNAWLGGTESGDQYFCPSDTGHGAGWIVIWGDTSGSRDDTEIASNMAELAGIMEDVNPQRLTVLWCDAEVSYIDEITDAADLAVIKARGAGGGGGTDYKPVLDWIRDQGVVPDLFIGFTDGYVSYPDREHEFATIWASSTDHKYPFGQVVRVNKVARSSP